MTVQRCAYSFYIYRQDVLKLFYCESSVACLLKKQNNVRNTTKNDISQLMTSVVKPICKMIWLVLHIDLFSIRGADCLV